jgi:hypothetical protein
MLKNKKAIYLLIPLNVFIWGYFVYRFYAAFTDGDLPPATPPVQVARVSELKDSLLYKLDLRYKDPFLTERGKSRSFNISPVRFRSETGSTCSAPQGT